MWRLRCSVNTARVARTRLFGLPGNVLGELPGARHQLVGRQDLGDEPELVRLLRPTSVCPVSRK